MKSLLLSLVVGLCSSAGLARSPATITETIKFLLTGKMSTETVRASKALIETAKYLADHGTVTPGDLRLLADIAMTEVVHPKSGKLTAIGGTMDNIIAETVADLPVKNANHPPILRRYFKELAEYLLHQKNL